MRGASFRWSQNGVMVKWTESPTYEVIVDKPGKIFISVQVYLVLQMQSAVKQDQQQLNATRKWWQRERTLAPALSNTSDPTIQEKQGLFQQQISVQEPLYYFNISGQRMFAVGQVVQFNMTSNGSVPTGICWNITKLNHRNHSMENFTCKPNVFINSTRHNLNISVVKTGWHSIYVMIYNDVSYRKAQHHFFAYDPNHVNVPALTIPIVFVSIAIVIVLCGMMYVVRLKKKKFIEVADFDFHPSLSRETTRETIQRLLLKAKHFFTEEDSPPRRRYAQQQSEQVRSVPTTQRNYSPGSLYESL